MATTTFTILDGFDAHSVEATVASGRVAIDASLFESALGWTLKPEGLCRGDVCVPVSDPGAVSGDAGIDLAGFAGALGRPLALDVDESVAALGTPAASRAAQMASLTAPDFTLPDLSGKLHSLSDHRGKKVLLIAYASW